jgi:2-succinyl-5-enolpyruvyl-6-hydroxy-3-cyclohexene-1-carboxylate synthase
LTSDGVAQRNTRFARHVIARLISEGCAGFVISPGSRNSPLVVAIASAEIPCEVILDERSAAFFALGWAKAAYAPVALVCTSGTAGAHYLPAVIEAHETGVPLFLVTADRPPELQGIGAPQTTRQERFFGNHVKGFLAVGGADDADAEDVLESLGPLLAAATNAKPGPIHLNIGFREPLWEPGPVDALLPEQGMPDANEQAEPIALPDAERGLLVVGPVQEARADARAAIEALARLAERRGWPILGDVASGLRQSGEGAAARVHAYDLFLRSGAAQTALEPELVVHVGRLPTSKSLFTWLQDLEDGGATVLHLSTDGQPHSLGRKPHVVDITWPQLLASCSEAQESLRGASGWLDLWRRAESETLAEIDARIDDTVCWEGAVAKVAARVPEGSHLLAASGMPIRDLDTFVGELPAGTVCLVNRGVNGIDGLIATAAGAAAQDPGRRTRLILGDLAFLHDLGSLALVAGRPNLEIVVVNNGGGGIFEFLPISQAGEVFEEFFLTPQRTDILAVTRAFGIEARRCTSPGQLEECLTAPLQGPRVVEFSVERARNVYIHNEVSEAVIARLDPVFNPEETDGEGSGGGRRGLESRQRL